MSSSSMDSLYFCILCTRPKSCFGGLNERWAATLFQDLEFSHFLFTYSRALNAHNIFFYLFPDLEFSHFLFIYSRALNAHNIFLSIPGPWILTISIYLVSGLEYYLKYFLSILVPRILTFSIYNWCFAHITVRFHHMELLVLLTNLLQSWDTILPKL